MVAAGLLLTGLAAATLSTSTSSATSSAGSGTAPLAVASATQAAPTSQIGLSVYRTAKRPLGEVGDVTIDGDGYGSAIALVPGQGDELYGLTDRGPNVDGPNDSKIEPIPGFTPAIGRFQLKNGKATLLQRIPLRAADGTRYNGQVNNQANTGETITDLNGTVLPASPYGYDSEGLVALPDGTFWVSDEYGPFITHFDARGRAIGRLSPFDASLPRELALRTPNKGMEGLTVTPDGKTLVGIMQSALTQTDAAKAKNVAVTRIVTINLRTRVSHEYAFVLDNPDDNGTAVSEITALSATKFVVDERDGDFDPGAYKKLWQVDVKKATDIGPRSSVGSYDGANGGLRVDGRSVEAIAGTGDKEAATAALTAAGITPVSQSLYLDLGTLVSSASPDGTFYDHDKIEGVAILNGGHTIVISNDSDFGLAGSTGDQPPYGLVAKTAPDGSIDRGEFLVINRN